MSVTKVKDALRELKLEEARLRSAALAYSCGAGKLEELQNAADSYGSAARYYKSVERQFGATLTPDEAEKVR